MDVADKFANLPGIVYDQPDCYETNDLPEADQQQRTRVRAEDVTSNVEILPLDVSNAFKRFDGCSVTVSGSDFSGVPADAKGYQTWGQWELSAGDRDQETPLQKYRRLQIEVQELQQTFADMQMPAAGNQTENRFTGDLRVENVSSDLKSMAASLKNLDVESCIENLMASSANVQTIAHLEQSLLSAKGDGAAEKSDTGSKSVLSEKGAVTYELTCPLTQSRSPSLSLVDQRLRALEQIVGSVEKVSPLTDVSGAKSICEAVSVLSNKVLLMDTSHLEQLDVRINSLIEKVSILSEKRSAVDDLTRESRVNELLQLMRETESQRMAMPAIAARLNRLSETEEQAIQFSSAISYIDSLQSEIVRDLTSSQEDVKLLKNSLQQAMALWKERADGFEKRLLALQK